MPSWRCADKPYRVVMDPWSGTILSVGRTR